MPRTYFAYNRNTDEILASPSFKRVYDSALLNLRYSDDGSFRIYAIDVDFDTFTYAQVLPMFTPHNLRCKLILQVLSNTIRVVNYPNGEAVYKSQIKLPKRDERIFDF